MLDFANFIDKQNESLLDEANYEELNEYYKGDITKMNKSTLEYCIRYHKYADVYYDSGKPGAATDKRRIGIVALGTSRAGNACIRVFQVKGDSAHDFEGNPWRLMLLKNIKQFKIVDTENMWKHAPAGFNPEDDKGMINIIRITKEW